jgi:hypothetical protein|tara:strand:- start:2143 stop:2457 length:315 start_codon:yes stop_codon:yes gene_type:complete
MSQLYASKELLIKLNNRAIRRKSNRTIKTKFLEKLPETLQDIGFEGEDSDDLVRYPVTQALPHNDVEMRVCFATHEGNHMWLDISFKEYDSLPQLDLATNNDVQ